MPRVKEGFVSVMARWLPFGATCRRPPRGNANAERYRAEAHLAPLLQPVEKQPRTQRAPLVSSTTRVIGASADPRLSFPAQREISVRVPVSMPGTTGINDEGEHG